MSLTPTFDASISRVRLAATSLTGASTALFERSRNGLLWTTVRGGTAAAVTAGAVTLDDYEFQPNATNYYRVTGTPGAVQFTADISPTQNDVWFKSLTKPFLNRAVAVVGHGDITRTARNAIFPVIGRTMPVAVTDVRLARSWEMTLKTEDPEDCDELELMFAGGEPLLVQVPATGPLSTVPGGYVVVGDIVRRRFGTLSPRRWLELPCTEVAAPGPDVYGLPATWSTVVAEFSDWDAVQTEFATWDDLLNYVSSPSVVVVP